MVREGRAGLVLAIVGDEEVATMAAVTVVVAVRSVDSAYVVGDVVVVVVVGVVVVAGVVVLWCCCCACWCGDAAVEMAGCACREARRSDCKSVRTALSEVGGHCLQSSRQVEGQWRSAAAAVSWCWQLVLTVQDYSTYNTLYRIELVLEL